VGAVGEASERIEEERSACESQEYKRRTSTDVGVDGPFMRGRDGVGNVRPIRANQQDKMERVEKGR
jgi:hypothetical protein